MGTAFQGAREKNFLKIENINNTCVNKNSLDVQRQDLLAGIVELLGPFVQIADLSNDALAQLLLYGNQNLFNDLNRSILDLTLRFIHETGRFD